MDIAKRANFSEIRYAQCWEDADVLLRALDVQPQHTCLSIASAGDNTLALPSRAPERVIALDVSAAPLACLELRVAAYRELAPPELLELIGSRASNQREALYQRCRQLLSSEARAFWDRHSDDIASGIGGAGKFEQYFALFRQRVLPFLHSSQRVAELLRDKASIEREMFYDDVWDTWRWRAAFKLFFSRFVMGRLGRDPEFFKYVEGDVAERILARTHYAATVLNPADNSYARWILTGRHLTTLPIFVIANLASGVLSLIPAADLRFPGAIDPAPVVQQIDSLHLNSTAASPALFERLADYCLPRQLQLTSLQKIFTGGAPVFPRLLDKLHRIAPKAHVVAVYGSTAAEPIAKLHYADIADDDRAAMSGGRGLLVGTPVPEIQLRLMADQWGTPIPPLTLAAFDAMQLAPNEPGEIVVTGEHVLTGYLHGRGDAETKFQVDGQVWHRTGDAGYLDERGRLWLLGRCAAKIEDARGTLYPFAVECAASDHPNVKRAALLQREGRRLLLVELSKSSENLDRLQQTLTWAALDEIRVLATIPVDKRHNAKVDYPALAKLLG